MAHRTGRGISTAVAMVVLIPFIVLALYMLIGDLSERASVITGSLGMQYKKMLSVSETPKGFYTPSATGLTITVENAGTSSFYLYGVYIYSEQGSVFLRFTSKNYSSPTSIVTGFSILGDVDVSGKGVLMKPGSRVIISVETAYPLTGVSMIGVTWMGKVFSIPRLEQAGNGTVVGNVSIAFGNITSLGDVYYYLFTNGSLVNNPDVGVVDAEEVMAPGDPSNPGSGISSVDGYGPWCLFAVLDNATVEIDNLFFTTAITGGDPSGNGEAIYAVTVRNYITRLKTSAVLRGSDGTTIDVRDLLFYYPAVKLVIYGFKGSLGGRYYVGDVSGYIVAKPIEKNGIYLIGSRRGYHSYIVADGSASKVFVYVRYSSPYMGCGDSVSYVPYLFFADTDGNNIPEMVFLTQDYYLGTTSDDGDDYPFDDVSTIPLTIYIKKPPIYSNYTAVLVSARLFFWDDAGEDYEELDSNKWIIRIGLYDPETGEIYSYQEYRYQFLSVLEDTYPPATDYFVMTAVLMVPHIPGKTFYIAISVEDPYANPGDGYNDADILVGVEFVSVLPISSSIKVSS